MRSKKEPSLCAKTQGRIANRVCRPRQDLRRTPPAVFGTHLVLYSRVSQKSTLKYQVSPQIPEKREKGSGEALRFSPVDLPRANQGIQIIFGRTPSRGASLAPAGQFTFCVWRKFPDLCALGAHTPVSGTGASAKVAKRLWRGEEEQAERGEASLPAGPGIAMPQRCQPAPPRGGVIPRAGSPSARRRSG